MEVVIEALIVGGCSLVGTFAGILTSTKLTNYRLEQLEKKVDAMSKFDEKLAIHELRIEQLERREY